MSFRLRDYFRSSFGFVIVCGCVASYCAAWAAEDPTTIDYSTELPRIAPTEPADTLKTFTVAPGFRLEQVAAEPLVNSPVAMEWDENEIGRAHV